MRQTRNAAHTSQTKDTQEPRTTEHNAQSTAATSVTSREAHLKRKKIDVFKVHQKYLDTAERSNIVERINVVQITYVGRLAAASSNLIIQRCEVEHLVLKREIYVNYILQTNLSPKKKDK